MDTIIVALQKAGLVLFAVASFVLAILFLFVIIGTIYRHIRNWRERKEKERIVDNIISDLRDITQKHIDEVKRNEQPMTKQKYETYDGYVWVIDGETLQYIKTQISGAGRTNDGSYLYYANDCHSRNGYNGMYTEDEIHRSNPAEEGKRKIRLPKRDK